MNKLHLVAKNILKLLVVSIIFTEAYAAQYLPLPDGSSVTIREGETPRDAWLRAQQMYPEAFKIKVIPNSKKYDTDYFNQCKMKAAKETTTDYALVTSIQSCEYKAVPKKCRIHNVEKDALGNEKGESRIQCVEQCNKANYYSKTLGECSKG